MHPGPAYLASDQHLGATPQVQESAFHRWLEHAAEHARVIFLNGDLFDFWFEWGSVVPRGHTRVLGILARIVDAGVPVHLMGGNHDWWGGQYLSDEVGLVLHKDPVRISLAGHRCLIAHGDGLGGGDLGYRALKRVLRSRLACSAFRWVHPDVASAVARRVSRTDADGTDSESKKVRAEALQRWARERLVEDEEIDLVLLGHSHVPARVEVAPQRYYLNAGDWVTHRTYVVLNEDHAPSLERWDEP